MEPHAIAANAVPIAASGSLATLAAAFGAQIDTIVIGFLAATFVVFWMPAINSRLRVASAILLASLFAGFGSPVAAHWAVANINTGSSSIQSLSWAFAVVIGVASPFLIPALLSLAQRKVESL